MVKEYEEQVISVSKNRLVIFMGNRKRVKRKCNADEIEARRRKAKEGWSKDEIRK